MVSTGDFGSLDLSSILSGCRYIFFEIAFSFFFLLNQTK